MDIKQMLLTQLQQYWWLIPILFLAAFFRSPMGKGILGEFMVNLFIKLFLDKKKYHLIKSVTLPTEDGTTQLDHIVVSRYGIFVLETKNYKGWIFGNERQKQWTQSLGGKKFPFQNPLHQNYKHLRTLEGHLGLPEKSVHSVISFVGDCTLKSNFPSNVTKGTGCISYIKSFKDEVYTKEQVTEFINAIEDIRLSRSLKTHVNHVKHVKEIVAEKQAESIPKEGPIVKIDDIPEDDLKWAGVQQEVSVQPDKIEEQQQPVLESSEKSQCPHCSGLMSIQYGKYGYYWKCSACNKNVAIKESCPACSTKMRIRKEKRSFFITCKSCEQEELYHQL